MTRKVKQERIELLNQKIKKIDRELIERRAQLSENRVHDLLYERDRAQAQIYALERTLEAERA